MPHTFKVILAVARLFLSERKIAKARTWFNKAVKLDPDFGDAWAAYYRFELQHGDESKQEAVAKHCLQAEPRHGEVWQRVSKRVENWRMSDADRIVAVAKELKEYGE